MAAKARPICPMCGEPGIHGSPQQCIDALRAERDRLRTQIAHPPQEPSVKYLGRWVPSFVP